MAISRADQIELLAEYGVETSEETARNDAFKARVKENIERTFRLNAANDREDLIALAVLGVLTNLRRDDTPNHPIFTEGLDDASQLTIGDLVDYIIAD